MVAVASPDVARSPDRRAPWLSRHVWSVAVALVLLVGVALRLALDPTGVGARSAAMMTALLGLGAFTTAWLLATPRTAFLVTFGLVALLDLAALPPRDTSQYDDRQAIFRTDQILAGQVAAAGGLAAPVLTLLVEPQFAGAEAPFGLAGEVAGVTLTWDCPLRRGMQRLALPLPADVLSGATPVDVRLHLTGSPTRERDYLLVYTSSLRGGPVLDLVGRANLQATATICSN